MFSQAQLPRHSEAPCCKVPTSKQARLHLKLTPDLGAAHLGPFPQVFIIQEFGCVKACIKDTEKNPMRPYDVQQAQLAALRLRLEHEAVIESRDTRMMLKTAKPFTKDCNKRRVYYLYQKFMCVIVMRL